MTTFKQKCTLTLVYAFIITIAYCSFHFADVMPETLLGFFFAFLLQLIGGFTFIFLGMFVFIINIAFNPEFRENIREIVNDYS